MEQVHGSKVVLVDSKSAGKIMKSCDVLVTSDKNATLRVDVADCLPIFIFDPTNNNIGLVHAGWRGLEKGVIANAIKLMSKEVVVYIGPHICQKHYEVKKNVYQKFADYSEVLMLKNGRAFLDLAEVARIQMIALGVKPKNITISSDCTFENKSLLSYRRDKTEKRTHYLFQIP
jgi:YfiH family protein